MTPPLRKLLGKLKVELISAFRCSGPWTMWTRHVCAVVNLANDQRRRAVLLRDMLERNKRTLPPIVAGTRVSRKNCERRVYFDSAFFGHVEVRTRIPPREDPDRRLLAEVRVRGHTYAPNELPVRIRWAWAAERAFYKVVEAVALAVSAPKHVAHKGGVYAM